MRQNTIGEVSRRAASSMLKVFVAVLSFSLSLTDATITYPPLTLQFKLHYDLSKIESGYLTFPDPYDGYTDNPNGYFGSTNALAKFNYLLQLDLCSSLGLPEERVSIQNIAVGDHHYTWAGIEGTFTTVAGRGWGTPSSNGSDFRIETPIVIASVALLPRQNETEPTVPDVAFELTRQIQEPGSSIYGGVVTCNIQPDASMGVYIPEWDSSVRLWYSMMVVGPLGSEARVRFENSFETDMANSLGIARSRVQVLFVISDIADVEHSGAVIVKFRVWPKVPGAPNGEPETAAALSQLLQMVNDPMSAVYTGEITIRTDCAYGLDGKGGSPRVESSRAFTFAPPPESFLERCKATHRCNRAFSEYNVPGALFAYWVQAFRGGEIFPANLFSDFEDPRAGTHGWTQAKCPPIDITTPGDKQTPPGAHFNSFQFPLNPVDLVLNEAALQEQILSLDAAIFALQQEIAHLYAKLPYMRDYNFGIQPNVYGYTYAYNLNLHPTCANPLYNNIWTGLNNKIADLEQTLDQMRDKRGYLEFSQCRVVACTLRFDTSALTLTGAISGLGEVALVDDGVEVAVFNFGYIDLGPEVSVEIVGERPLVLLSRSSIYLNTVLNPLTGYLGGFAGALRTPSGLQNVGGVSKTASVNVNGPGSGSVRIYAFTVVSEGEVVREVQRLRTWANPGQTISGSFQLQSQGHCHGGRVLSGQFADCEHPLQLTTPISHDVSADELRREIEAELTRAGSVEVHRCCETSEGGVTWDITFISAIGDVGQLKVLSSLSGGGVGVEVTTLQEANVVTGHFIIDFMGYQTRSLPSFATSEEMRQAMLEDVPTLLSVDVTRTDNLGICDNGKCLENPQQAGGYTWTLLLTTEEGNVSPSDPLSIEGASPGPEAVFSVLSSLLGQEAEINVFVGHDRSASPLLPLEFTPNLPFSFSFGGQGAGHGARGGVGQTSRFGPSYAGEGSGKLCGGSGGAAGGKTLLDILPFGNPLGRGGSGGGAIELSSINDIVIGYLGQINVNGDDGDEAPNGGGGASGGTILLAAGGVIENHGFLTAQGGNGGDGTGIGGNGGGGGSGGRIEVFAQSFANAGSLDVSGGDGGEGQASSGEDGHNGIVYTETKLAVKYHIDDTTGAEGTHRSLVLYSYQALHTPAGVPLEASHGGGGPINRFGMGVGVRPDRVTYYVKMESGAYRKAKGGWGSLFALRDIDGRVLVGVRITNRGFMHGANFIQGQGGCQNVITRHVECGKWYKVDIFLRWHSWTYEILLNDLELVIGAPFSGNAVDGIGLYNFRGGLTWYDQIYVGPDFSMGFTCPQTTPTGVHMDRPAPYKWPSLATDQPTQYSSMTRHESHLSKREELQNKAASLYPYDGEPHVYFTVDAYQSHAKTSLCDIKEGELLTCGSAHVGYEIKSKSYTRGGADRLWDAGSTIHGSTKDYFWYGAYDVPGGMEPFHGGVFACSTDDFIHWRREGVMLHYANITDMAHGRPGPIVVRQPKVLINPHTGKYVMWMIVEDLYRTYGLAGVAVSSYNNGPFVFVRSFYPDGNCTHEQAVVEGHDGKGYLVRTFYFDVEFVLPKPIMQPMWESVKYPNGETNYGLNYHRAVYHPDYDDYHDIYLQRWRKEDKEWRVLCMDEKTGNVRELPRGQMVDGQWLEEEHCGRYERKVTEGQGYPAIRSRFKDPWDPENNYWMPSSIPGVQAQPWQSNYIEGQCGRRDITQGFSPEDPSLPFRDVEDRSSCSNIADNPVHPTGPDKLEGAPHVVQIRRTKYISISRLTFDYLETTGEIKVIEGGVEDEDDIFGIIRGFDGLGWAYCEEEEWDYASDTYLETTYRPYVYSEFQTSPDWRTRFYQYVVSYNDRAQDSIACLSAGQCPVNFRDQI